MAEEHDYNKWTKAGLISKLRDLEHELKRRPAPPALVPDPVPVPEVAATPQDGLSGAVETEAPGKPKAKGKRKIDPSKYATRHIALKFAYLGKRYGGYEFAESGTLTSIEEELFKALTKACLIFPKDERVVDFDGCEYAKCGRTDRGVSAFGQVISLRVRSNRPLPKKRIRLSENSEAVTKEERPDEIDEDMPEERPFDPILDEIPYPHVLNRLLPSDITILAWCPSPPSDFSARFSCRERQYRYFFTQPAFSPDPTQLGHHGGDASKNPAWLDIEAMRDAAKRFEGEHDFRNFCKIDPAKQMTNFTRKIFEADIQEVKDVNSALAYLDDPALSASIVKDGENRFPKVYSFNVNGSAFLWHQIRHMVAVLFFVGQRLESPSLVSELLDVGKNPGKPTYGMADEVPLVLWDCIFPERGDAERIDALDWVYIGDDKKFSNYGHMERLWEVWRERKMDELLANRLLDQVALKGISGNSKNGWKGKATPTTKMFEGANKGRTAGKYVPVMKKGFMETPEELNEKYAKRLGYKNSNDMRTRRGYRQGVREDEKADE